MTGRLLRLAMVTIGLLVSGSAEATAETTTRPGDTGEETPSTSAPLPVVDLNRASVQELCTLPGIGPRKAEAIISLREKRPFTRVTQLLLVKGIGPKTLARLKPRLMVGPPPLPAPTPGRATNGGPMTASQ